MQLILQRRIQNIVHTKGKNSIIRTSFVWCHCISTNKMALSFADTQSHWDEMSSHLWIWCGKWEDILWSTWL